jgi:hypothetical protein
VSHDIVLVSAQARLAHVVLVERQPRAKFATAGPHRAAGTKGRIGQHLSGRLAHLATSPSPRITAPLPLNPKRWTVPPIDRTLTTAIPRLRDDTDGFPAVRDERKPGRTCPWRNSRAAYWAGVGLWVIIYAGEFRVLAVMARILLVLWPLPW